MIQMIAGVYGLYDGGRVIGMSHESGPFSIDPEREAELVAAGIAEYVSITDAPIGFDEQPPANDASDDIQRAENEKTLDEMTAKELREVGKEYGLSFKVGMTKAEMIAAIRAGYPNEEDTSDDEQPPAFDASEAVEE